jgi:DNA-binding MarR family transcriptional regulator
MSDTGVDRPGMAAPNSAALTPAALAPAALTPAALAPVALDAAGSGLAETIGRLRRAMRRAARAADPGNQLSVAQLELLACLAERPGARPGQLARLLNLRANTVTTLVNALTQQEMISRSAADQDRRAVTLTLTDEGRRAVHAWHVTNSSVLHIALSTLPAGQRGALARATPALDALIQAIDHLADAPAPIDNVSQ